MSEPKLISPMLDGFAMGDPISDRHGVRCCPAMPNHNNERYIVKIISVPASQVQLQALLLTGAYNNEEAARDYFQGLAQGIVEETEILKTLANVEGFLPFDNCQVVPMEKEVGYDVYMLNPYRRSLARHFRRDNLTHLAAVNLGLDMCAALAVCRQSGYLYTNLKPENIFLCGDKEYRIGDIGFLRLDSLKYASLPQRCIGAYTPPEIVDAYSDINTTLDIYAAGLILYQAYNGGVLPFTDRAGSEPLPPPAFADYEMAEIILKACAPDPADRWADPMAMGQALVAYMQRNGANDTPIVTKVEEHDEETFAPESESEETDVANDISLPPVFTVLQEDQICLDEFYALIDSENTPNPDTEIDESLIFPEEDDESEDEDEDDEDLTNLSFLDSMVSDDTAPSEDMADDFSYGELSEDASDILSHADDLISHETPEGVIPPEPIDVPIPEPLPIVPEAVPEEEPEEEPEEVIQEQPEEEPEESSEDASEEEEYDFPVPKKDVAKKVITTVIILLIIAALAFGGWFFYKEYYLRNVTNLTLIGSENRLLVQVDANVADEFLTVICTDTHGNPLEAPVVNGQAEFTGLNPNMLYTVKVEVSGLRKLVGETSDNYTTPVQSNIVSFNAITGNEEGSVILSFTVDGMDADTWTITYSADGEPEQSVSFSGHMVNLSNLTTDKTYTFRISTQESIYITGSNTLEYTAIKPVFAENLAVVAYSGDSLKVSWNAPEGSQVTSWTVRCYSENGFDSTITVEGTTAEFTGITASDAHTVEVTAAGMSSPQRCYVTANAVTVTEVTGQCVDSVNLLVSWAYSGNKPAGKWMVIYTIDGNEQQNVLLSDNNSAVISNFVPNATYHITIQLEDGTTVFGQAVTTQTPEAASFSGYALKANNISGKLCKTPDVADWDRHDLADEDYTDTFAVGTKASVLLRSNRTYARSDDMINIMFIIRDAEGKLVSYNSLRQTWSNLWYRYNCELDIPAIPDAPGDYTLDVCFNGSVVFSSGLHITQ